MNLGIDGKALMNSLMRAEAAKNGDKFIVSLIDVFEKYNLSLIEGTALMAEVINVIKSIDEEGENDDC